MILGMVLPRRNAMSLQARIIKEYRIAYPMQSLNQIAENTGIQVTRVFRLFKGPLCAYA